MDQGRVEKVVQLALLCAGEAEDGSDLGPIHLLKYAYLADLAYAERHEGETYTGAVWRFHHFGPWESQVHNALEPALSKLGANRQQLESKFDKEWVRWSLNDEPRLRRLERELPSEVVSTVKKSVRNFGHDTAELLHYVYLTEPMLHATPGDDLDFSTALKKKTTASTASDPPVSRKQEKRRQTALDELRARTKEKLRLRREASVTRSYVQPRFDDVFLNHLAADLEASTPPVQGKVEISFEPGVFESATRREERD